MSDRLALIIANGEFDDPKLTRLATPVRDAEALAQLLSDPSIGGFQVALLVNKTLGDVRRGIARLYRRRKRSDLLLLYYSGHGVKDDFGDLYLAVQDTESEIVNATALDAAFVRDQLDKSGSQRKVVVLDCCHSGAFARGGKAILGSSAGAGEAFAGSGHGRVVLTASNAVEYAWEGDELLGEAETSVFTRFLAQGLRTGAADLDDDGKISVDELYDYTYEQIITGGFKQTPQKWAQKVEGQLIVARNPYRVVKPAELPPELRQAVESDLAWMREGAVSGLERLLRGSDKGLALAAREALERLAGDDSRRVSDAAAGALGVASAPVSDKAPPTHPPPVVSAPVERRPAREPRKRPTLPSGAPLPWGWVGVAGLAVLALIIIFTVVYLSTRGDGEDRETVVITATNTSTPEGVDVPSISTDTPHPTATSEPTNTVAPPSSTPEPTVTATRPTDTPHPTATPTLGVGVTMPRATDGMVMVYVPGGEFEMGTEDGDSDEQPVHSVTLDGFWMDHTEVSNAQYAAFLNERGNQTEGGVAWLDLDDADCLIEQVGGEYRPKNSYENHPVIEVSWYGAAAYCEWTGARLPTEAEWEYAARGPDGKIYPWGDAFDGARLNFCDANCTYDWKDTGHDDGYERTSPVGSYEDGASWCGALDMAGNVWEWVNDWYQSDYYDVSPSSNPPGPETGDHKVLRGGAWYVPSVYARSADRVRYLPVYQFVDWGFRCVVAPTSSSLPVLGSGF